MSPATSGWLGGASGASGAALLIVGAYLLGSVSFSYLLVRLRSGLDIRTVGSGNAGATNVLRVAGRGTALAALALDVLKGALPVWGALQIAASPAVVGAVAVATVLGHVFPLFHGFRGGKGVATAAGALGTLDPAALLAGLVVFAVAVGATRYVSLGSVLSTATFPLALWLLPRWSGRPPVVGYIVASLFVAIVIVWKHRENLGRLASGNESKLGGRTSIDGGEST